MTIPDLDLDRTGIVELRQRIVDGAFTARALTQHCLDRIDSRDAMVDAVIELNPEAPAIAEELDRALGAGRPAGPLHGLPILIKDNIDTGDRMTTTAGSLVLEGTHAAHDAPLVARLREAGAVILGKTNLSEWANYRSAASSSGWSSRGGQTRNPYALDRTPGGSSSGSGVAAACGFCVAAVGTETDGSIVSPSAMNGVVGIKPTVGLVSRSGIVPISHSQDTAGPIARTVADAALVLGVMAGTDPRDPATAQADSRRARDYTDFLDADGLRGARIGVIRSITGFSDDVVALMDDVAAALRDAGAVIVDPVDVVDADAIRPPEKLVMSTEIKVAMAAYLASRGAGTPVADLAGIIAANRARSAETMPYFPQDRFEEAEKTKGLEDPAYLEARETCLRLTRTEGIDKALVADKLDALVAPTTCAPWLIDWVNGDNRGGSSAYLAAISGYPSVTVPAGFLHGLPVGVSFMASAWQEPTLIRLAHAFEQATQVRVPPQYLTTAAF